MKLIQQDILDTIKATLSPELADKVQADVQDLNDLVNELESKPLTTKDYYDAYLQIVKSRDTALLLIMAGANRHGVMVAARINGIDL